MLARLITKTTMIHLNLAIAFSALNWMTACDQPAAVQASETHTVIATVQPPIVEKTVVAYDGITRQRFINNVSLFQEGWDTLAQTMFWQQIITLSHDSMILNVAGQRRQLYTVSTDEWHCQTEPEKDLYKQSLCAHLNLDSGSSIYVTAGKKFFFEHKKVLPLISRSIPIFEKQGVDPWYAQTILLIESPGKTEARSSVGARGPFQLMPYVARRFGLVVNRYRDDRTNLEKSAFAAARLIQEICIPHAQRILQTKGITAQEEEMWFRLFVMHIYHAGATNVEAVVNKINPTEGGMELIRTLWVTEARGFKNESQNYSQIALASLVQFDNMIQQDNDTVYLVTGDKNLRAYYAKTAICVDTLDFLESCLTDYEADLVEGTIPMDYFTNRTATVRREMERYYSKNGIATNEIAYRESERLHNLGNELMYKRKFNEAILIFQLGIEQNPISPATYDSLGKAYRKIGNIDLADKYAKKSRELSDQNPQQPQVTY